MRNSFPKAESSPRGGDSPIEDTRRQEVELDHSQSTQRYDRLISTIPCAVYDYVLCPDGGSRFCYISPQCEDIFELTATQIMADAKTLWGLVHPADATRLSTEDAKAMQTHQSFQSEVRINLPSGPTKWIQLTSRPGPHQIGNQQVWSGVILDITARKQVEAERNRLVRELQSALAEVKTLSGFLPICSGGKKIRDNTGYWNQIEASISDHSDAEFSHGICPDCAENYYEELRRMEAATNRPSLTAQPAGPHEAHVGSEVGVSTI
ncbi:MAG: PAS domain-containing protein [Candidatus Synoicihabitans palmerolidicus]|nr:PAS domain-containing protein [Candidatus Synoicihabitans palmerolidicus]